MGTRWTEQAFSIAPSTIPGAGLGLFAQVPIAIEDTIGYYTGELITYDALAAGRFAGSDYLLGLTSKWLIAGEGPKANYTRFINHSDAPNAFLIVSTRWKTARFEAIRARKSSLTTASSTGVLRKKHPSRRSETSQQRRQAIQRRNKRVRSGADLFANRITTKTHKQVDHRFGFQIADSVADHHHCFRLQLRAE